MNRIIKKGTAFILLCILWLAAPLRTYASGQSGSLSAGAGVEEAIQLILSEYIGSDISYEQLYEGALRGIGAVLDEYSEYMTDGELEEFSDYLAGSIVGIGITYQINEKDQFEIVSVMEDSPAEKAGLYKGDIIIRANGLETAAISLEQLYNTLTDESVKKLDLDVEREGEILSFSITKGVLTVHTVIIHKPEELLPASAFQDSKKDRKEIGTIQITYFGDDTADDFAKAVSLLQRQGVTRLILDLRGNPGGLLDAAYEIACMLVPAGPVFYTIDIDGDGWVFESDLETLPFEKMTVLVDGNTASAAELLAAALQDSKAAEIVGVTSFGKGVIQGFYPLETGGVLKLTIMEYLRRSGEQVHMVGVKPDIAVRLPDPINGYFTLDAGNNSPGIMDMIKILRYLGYSTGPLNSNYDEKTQKAVMEFQKQSGLTDDGKITYETILCLNMALSLLIEENDPMLQKAYETIIK